ncbi:metallophosphatase [Corallococcus sp. AB032C]|uniref:alkaline phosphatase D family protein n=1 Tax=Corallococcus sp. AB032C TaxID=2316717 RepID=UPI000EEBFBD8|nr:MULTISPECIES: alkaline phosphatase D family protein [Corallococcus]NPC51779.1 metallophosphatase [Corallococcus exiguus]RKH80652.1 metallophosphatase [Corallococcus sp. AB032C]
MFRVEGGGPLDFEVREPLHPCFPLESIALFNPFKRRTFLQAVVAVAATTTFGCSDDDSTETSDGSPYFPQSLASGDPRPDSVVLWVRVEDKDRAGSDLPLRLEVSPSEDFKTLVLDKTDLSALAEHDHAVKVKVTGLSARTTYYYRFSYEKDGQKHTTRTGRTRTAPAAGDDVQVKFVFASCQDFIGRYYNAWQRLLQLDADLDFIVFLGDYVYETTGDTSFQSGDGGRSIRFSDPDGALPQGAGLTSYLAANSLSNYRDLYKTTRTDKQLQAVHERYPFIIVWDDHEFSDDCWQDVATYEDGKRDETQLDRKLNAEQAFLEYIPLDTVQSAAGAIDVASEPRFPNSRIYRDFEYGKHLKLLVTDYRSYRPDHLIPEDGYPGTVALDATLLGAALQGQPDVVKATFQADTFAYVNIDDAAYANQKQVLQAVYLSQAKAAGLTDAEAAQKAGKWVAGPVALYYVNQVLAAVNKALVIPPADKPRGLAYAHMGKAALFNIQGSRYVVVKDTFDLFAAVKYQLSQGKSEDVFGPDQEAWFQQTMTTATNTWKMVVSSTSLSALIWDFRQQADITDPTLRQRFYFSVDQWDGFPTKKKVMLNTLKAAGVTNTLFISGDIHASFASVEEGVPVLTAPGITSGSIKSLASLALIGAGYSTGAPVYQHAVVEMEKTLMASNSGLRFADADSHGFVLVEVKADETLATFHLIPAGEVAKDYSKRADSELEAKFTAKTFRVKNSDIQPA